MSDWKWQVVLLDSREKQLQDFRVCETLAAADEIGCQHVRRGGAAQVSSPGRGCSPYRIESGVKVDRESRAEWHRAMAKVCKESAELLGRSTSPEIRADASCKRAMADYHAECAAHYAATLKGS